MSCWFQGDFYVIVAFMFCLYVMDNKAFLILSMLNTNKHIGNIECTVYLLLRSNLMTWKWFHDSNWRCGTRLFCACWTLNLHLARVRGTRPCRGRGGLAYAVWARATATVLFRWPGSRSWVASLWFALGRFKRSTSVTREQQCNLPPSGGGALTIPIWKLQTGFRTESPAT